jgi:hypothetical protein
MRNTNRSFPENPMDTWEYNINFLVLELNAQCDLQMSTYNKLMFSVLRITLHIKNYSVW